jgi:hypothetical protein
MLGVDSTGYEASMIIVGLSLQNMASSSSTVRQTVTTTVQQSPSLDNNLGTYQSTNI